MDALKIQNEFDQLEKGRLSGYGTPSADAVRRKPEEKPGKDYRQAFSVDADRILNSLAYARYIDKTQVFYLIQNDHITHRVLHVQLVSKIARTIGRYLRLNEDLIEAVALGHDIGHAPFGHDGERFLSRLCREHGIGSFSHNVQSVRFLDRVERKGRGWNLTLQVLDGILCHDGEVDTTGIEPERHKDFKVLFKEAGDKRKQPGKTMLIPMTMEACVVRVADTVGYVGRDIEDAIRLGLVSRKDLPGEVVRKLGNTNGTIVYALVTDLIENSRNKPRIAFSEGTARALISLKRFNYERIYMNPKIKQAEPAIEKLYGYLFEKLLTDYEDNRRNSVIFTDFLGGMDTEYRKTQKPAEIVRDFIAGMTDRYFLHLCPTGMHPKPVDL